MPVITIHREKSENDTSKLPSWALIPSPRSPRTAGPVTDSRALIPYYVPAHQTVPGSENYDQPSNPYIPNPEEQDQFRYPETENSNNATGLTFYFATQVINITAPVVVPVPCPCEVHHHDQDSGSPRVVVEEALDSDSDTHISRSPRSPRTPQTPQESRYRKSRTTQDIQESRDAPKLFSWSSYTPIILPKKRSPAMRTSHEEVIDAFDGVEMGPVSGLGRLAKPLINKYHTSGHVSEFQASGERVLLLPDSNSEEEPKTPNSTRREVERLECEMFDISKYRGNTEYLTVLTWASDSHWGTITLFEVDTEQTGSNDENLRRRRKSRRSQEHAVNIRPVAAMEDVPKGILVNMRLDQDVRKTVLEYSTSEGRYKWRSQVKPGPSYARVLARIPGSTASSPGFVGGGGYDEGWGGEVKGPKSGRLRSEEVILSSEGEDEEGNKSPYTKRGRRRERRDADGELERDYHDDVPDRRRHPRPSSLLRVEDALNMSPSTHRHRTRKSTSSRSHSRTKDGRAETDPDTGIVATIPQFMALLHANRSIIEGLDSVAADELVEVDQDGTYGREGRAIRCITLAEKPVGKRHAGRDVHVVVLMPNASAWAEEQILWTDEDGELAELRQKVFWDVIERGRSCSRASSRASSRSEGNRSPRTRESRSADGRETRRRTGGRGYRGGDERSRSPPKSARW